MNKIFIFFPIILSCSNTSNACQAAEHEFKNIEIGYGLTRMPEGVSIVGRFGLSQVETDRKRVVYKDWLKLVIATLEKCCEKMITMDVELMDIPSNQEILNFLERCSCSIEPLFIDVFPIKTNPLNPEDRFVFRLHQMSEDDVLLNICHMIDLTGKISGRSLIEAMQWKTFYSTIKSFLSNPQERPATPFPSIEFSRPSISPTQNKPVELLGLLDDTGDKSFEVPVSPTKPESSTAEESEDLGSPVTSL